MNILFSGLWVSNEIVQAICLTLIHSIWQGLLAAFITGMIILFSKKHLPEPDIIY